MTPPEAVDNSPDQAAALVATVTGLRSDARAYFADAARALGDEGVTYTQFDRDFFWNKLPSPLKESAGRLTSRLIKLTTPAIEAVVRSPILNDADRQQLGHSLKAMRAALRFRKYQHWDAHVIHDEDRALGIEPASQRETFPLPVDEARAVFDEATDALTDAIELSGGTTLSTAGTAVDPAAPAVLRPARPLRPGTAFMMMWMDPRQPDLTDVSDTVKRCFRQFEVVAQRADDIEHEDVITARILDEIRTSELLFADLTGERPSVYYEVGYAHAIGRRVMLYRKKGTRIHFDLAAYNCPEYKNLHALEELLTKRLQEVTGEKPKRS